jgi:heptosyltransferase-2
MIQCRHFNGYKPCGKSNSCNESCAHLDAVWTTVLIVHLGALGAVVRSTSLLKAIKRKFPASAITWVTDAPADKLITGHPLIDRVLTTREKDMLQLSALEFDAAFVIDKSLKAVGVLKRTQADLVYGFTSEPRHGVIVPATPAAQELWELGLDDHKKLFVNRKPETQLMIEALELGPYRGDDYFLPLNWQEESARSARASEWSMQNQKVIVGFNTGCSDVIAAKKLSVEFQRRLIQNLQKNPNLQIVLLGGPEDTQRNAEIAQGLSVVSSATEGGLRDGLVSVAACDVIVTGDSLGMHMAISQQKYTVAWFGPTCAHEIDLYGRGEVVLSSAPCSPCWKRVCSQKTMCYDQVSENDFMSAIEKGIQLVRQPHRPDSLLRGYSAQLAADEDLAPELS